MAIAFHNAADLGNNGGSTSSHSAAYDVGSGSDRLLVVGIYGDVTGGNDDISSVTYNSVAMSLVAKVTNIFNGRVLYLYFLTNPTSGSNNVVVTAGSTHYLIVLAASYTGVNASGQPDGSDTDVGTSVSNVTANITTTADNCWLIGVGASNFTGSGLDAGAGTVERVQESAGSLLFLAMFDSDSATTPAGSDSLIIAGSGGVAHLGIVAASFAPATAGGPLTPAAGAMTLTGQGTRLGFTINLPDQL